jgi:hypothetical protein
MSNKLSPAESAHVTRAKARQKIVAEFAALKAAGTANPLVVLAAKYGKYPTTIQKWLSDERRPAVPLAKIILETK